MVVAAMLLVLAGSLAVPSPEPLPVIGGDVAEDCQWPATVLMSGCSGTLVHPEIVMYAAHCPNAGSVRFGTTGGERSVSTTTCRRAPEYPQTGFDYAYCQLSQPVTDVPIVPVMMGCERDQLPIGKPAWLVGFGNTSNQGGGFGTKRWIEGEVAGFPADGKQIGIFYDDPETGICNGDSGGSAYTQLEDGTWRMFGIASTVPGSCGGSSQHIPAWAAVAWIEEDSGIDITPCHDADGAWSPGPDCTGFPTDPGSDNGLSWNSGCGPGPIGTDAMTCGPATGEPQDLQAPSVSILRPSSGAYPGPALDTDIVIDIADDTGILDVTVTFADEVQAVFEAPPYIIRNVVFPEGTWELEVSARDWSGNITEESVTVDVGVEPGGSSGGQADESSGDGGDPSDAGTDSGPTSGDPGTTDPGMTGNTTTGAEASSSDGMLDADGDSGGSDGCGCRQSSPASTALLLLLALGLRRRR